MEEQERAARAELAAARRIVVKVGTSTLAYGPGRMNLRRIEHLVRELVDISNAGREVILVSSGAIAAGLGAAAARSSRRPSPRSRRSPPSGRACSCTSTRSSSPSMAGRRRRCS